MSESRVIEKRADEVQVGDVLARRDGTNEAVATRIERFTKRIAIEWDNEFVTSHRHHEWVRVLTPEPPPLPDNLPSEVWCRRWNTNGWCDVSAMPSGLNSKSRVFRGTVSWEEVTKDAES